jgi:hypothetical protein
MLSDRLGFSPEIRNYLAQMLKAMAGDLVFVVTPATVTPVPITGAWTRTVYIELQSADGKVHTWFDKAITTGVSVGDTSSLGTATIASTTLTFVEGKASVVVTGSAHAWANTETDTLTIAQATILGYTVASKTSVETFTT